MSGEVYLTKAEARIALGIDNSQLQQFMTLKTLPWSGAFNKPTFLLEDVNRLKAEIEALRTRMTERISLAGITPERTLLEIGRIAFANLAKFYNPDGTIKKPTELDEDQQAVLAGFEVCIKNTEAGDGIQDLIYKFKTWDKNKALEMLAKHFKLFGDETHTHVHVHMQIENRLARARQIAAEAEVVNESESL